MHAHLIHFDEPPFADYLRDQLEPGIRLTNGTDIPDPAGLDVLIAGRPSRDQLVASPNLQTLIIPFAGLPDSTRALLADFPQIAVYNLHHNDSSAAEMAVALLLAAVKNIVPADRVFRRHDWTPRHAPMPMGFLDSKTALILGYGAIGQRVAAVCRAFGMHVIGIKRRVEGQYPDEIHPMAALPDLLPRADALIICLPLTDQTQNLIGAAEIALLPRQAVIVNVGRAAIVEQVALYEALRDGRLHGAGFDVWYTYPPDAASRTHTPPADVPFHELDNMVMSPHRAGGVYNDALEYKRMDALAIALNAAYRGDPIPNPVDVAAGY